MTTNGAAKTPCQCGCGTLVTGRWARGHARKGAARAKVSRLPSPADIEAGPDGDEDLGILEPADHPAGDPGAPTGPAAIPVPAADPGGDDEPPAHAARDWGKTKGRTARGPREARRPPRVTATIRGDINAKISMPLEIGGRIWAARDPLCGGTFVAQRGEIADALTEIVCQSSDLVAWFTGAGGGFLLYLNLTAATWPVVEAILAHHVYHSRGMEQDPYTAAGPDLSRYAA